MGMTTDGLSHWQAESEGIELLDTASGKVQKFVLREQAIKVLGLEDIAKMKTA
jgi:hypothetical protein